MLSAHSMPQVWADCWHPISLKETWVCRKLSQTSKVLLCYSFFFLGSINLNIESHNQKQDARKDSSSQICEYWTKRFVCLCMMIFFFPANIPESIKQKPFSDGLVLCFGYYPRSYLPLLSVLEKLTETVQWTHQTVVCRGSHRHMTYLVLRRKKKEEKKVQPRSKDPK